MDMEHIRSCTVSNIRGILYARTHVCRLLAAQYDANWRR